MKLALLALVNGREGGILGEGPGGGGVEVGEAVFSAHLRMKKKVRMREVGKKEDALELTCKM
eukprot:549750-Hanusia_phi.AAC.2